MKFGTLQLPIQFVVPAGLFVRCLKGDDPVTGLNDAFVKSIAAGVRNLPVRFPAASRRSSTVIASGTPPFGVQLPDQVPLIAVRSAAATVTIRNTDVRNTNKTIFMAPK